MPSKTPKQAKFMRAIAHGWTPSRMKSPPSRAVAQEFVEADKKYSGGFAENRYSRGGLAAMGQVDSGSERQRPLNQLNWRRGGRVIPLEPGINGPMRRAALEAEGYQYDPNTNSMHEPESTIAGTAETPTYDPYYGARDPNNAWGLPSMPWRNWENYQSDGEGGYTYEQPEDWLDPGGGGPGGPSEPPPRIIPTDPAAYVGASSDTSGRGSEYRKKLRKHQNRIEEILGTGNAEGGPVNYYEEGGAVRPGHAEGPNPYNEADPLLRKSYARWEAKHHIDPAPPPPPPTAAAPEEEGGIAAWLRSFFMDDPETANVAKRAEQLEELGEARGGRINYQTGGLAIAAPAGGVPPWIEPTGMEESVGYQFGGGVPYRGVPPQRRPMQPRGGSRFSRRFQRRQAPVGGGPQRGGLAAMMQQAQQQRAGASGIGPSRFGPGEGELMRRTSGADDMLNRMNRQLPGGGQFGGMLGREESMADRLARTKRMATGQQTYADVVASGGGGINPIMNKETGERLNDYTRPTGEVGINPPPERPFQPPPGRRVIGGSGEIGDPYQYGRNITKPRPAPGTFGPGEGIPGGGNIPPWKRPPGGRPQVPPSPGGEITGGPRVPPNMQGYLQKMRMQNRPPSGPVGGGGNRVGMQDQQGAFARAMQRGTGRAPTSRRMGFGRAGPTP